MEESTYLMNWTMFKAIAGLTYFDRRGVEHVKEYPYSEKLFNRYRTKVEGYINMNTCSTSKLSVAVGL